MALFFDAQWFDAKLREQALTRDDVGLALRLSAQEVAELWKDQRELKSHEVMVLARLLAVDAREIANRAGVSTPVPKPAADVGAMGEKLEELNGRLIKLERMMAELKTLLLDRKS